MDRDELNAMLAALENGEVLVKPDGTLLNNETNDEFDPAPVLAALAEVEDAVARLRKVAEWAATAPEIAK